jgi:hypothetical protein
VRASVLCLLLASLVAPAARAEVAVAVSIPDVNAVHRDFAAGIVDEARARFAVQSPTLRPREVAACSGDEKCIVELAARSNASHVLVVGIAAIGPAEFVVSLRLFDAASGESLTGVSDVASPGRDPREAGRALAKQAFASVTGLPPPAPAPQEDPPPAPSAPPDPRYSGVSPLSLAGWGIVGVSAVGAAGGVVVGGFLQETSGSDFRTQFAVVGGAATAGLGLGLGLVVLDQLLAKPSTEG